MTARPLLLALPILLIARVASGQVLITEILADGANEPEGEWIELNNIGTGTVDIGGWQIGDNGGAARLYAFPAGTMLTAGQVIVVAVNATEFNAVYGMTPAFELALPNGSTNDAAVPDLTASASGTAWGLGNGGDGAVLMNGATMVSAVEWGTGRTEIAGTGCPVAPQGQSVSRIANTGTLADWHANTDFAVLATPSPGVGFTPGAPTPPTISMPTRSPANFAFADQVTLGATVVDADGVSAAQVYAAIATSSTGPAAGAYAPQTAVSGAANVYSFTAAVETVGGTFTEPAGFHERYLRWYLSASDTMNNTSTLPANATSAAGSAIYYWENVLPTAAVFSIADARAQGANERPTYEGHSVRVEGVVSTRTEAFVAGATNFFIASPTGVDAIRVFDDVLTSQTVAPGDTVRVTGRIGVFRGVRQIGRDERGAGSPQAAGSELTISVLSSGAAVPQQTLTVAALLAAGESNESQLVQIAGLTMTTGPAGEPIPTAWSASATAYATDGTGTIAIRTAANTDLIGAPPPAAAFTLTGIFTQFANTGVGGYQVQPRSAADIPGTTPVDGGVSNDSGTPDPDSGTPQNDSGTPNDSGPRPDAGQPGADSGQPQADGGSMSGDAGARIDTGVFGQDPERDEGCGCATSGSGAGAARTGLMLASLIGLTALGRRRKR